MNVLILTALYPPAVGGAATYYSDLIAALSVHDKIGRIVVLTEHRHGWRARDETKRMSVLRLLPPRVSRMQTNQLIHAATYVQTDVFLLMQLTEIVRQYDIDIIQFHSRYRSSLTHRVLRRTGCAIVADLRDRMLDPRRVLFCDAVLCCAESLHGLARAEGVPEEKLFYIPNPLPHMNKPAPKDISPTLARYRITFPRFLLFVGDITPAKGIYELLDGHRLYAQRTRMALPLILVGANREGERFRKYLRKTTMVTYLGAASRQDVLALMMASSAVVLPSKSEGLPTVILEALALGGRVMCPPDVGEFARYCPDWTLPAVNAETIADFLARLNERTDLPKFPLDEYTLPHVAERLVQVYGDILAHRR